MARNKDSRFGVADGFDFNDKYEKNTQEAQQVQEVQEEYTRSTRGTQGRKGCKMPRINMAFEPDIHEWIQRSARQNGITMTNFVNLILREKMDSENGSTR